MATFKTVKGVSKNASGLRKVLGYVAGENEKEKVAYLSGYNCSDNVKDCYKEFIRTKELFDKVDGRQYRHHIQSFQIGEIDEKTSHEIALKFAQENYQGFQVLIATHKDKEHIHTHFIINSVCMENGMKLRELNNKEIKEKENNNEKYKIHEKSVKELRNSNDKLCKEYGLSVIEKGSKTSDNIYDKKKYMVYKNHMQGKQKSYKIELAQSIVYLADRCTSRKEFIDELKKKGIDVDWKDTRKHIVFKFSDTKKKSIRLETLKKETNINIFDKDILDKKFFENNKLEEKYNKQKDQEEKQLKLREERRIRELKAEEEKAKRELKEKLEQIDRESNPKYYSNTTPNKTKKETEIGIERENSKIDINHEEEKETNIDITTKEKTTTTKQPIVILKKKNKEKKKKINYEYDEETKKWKTITTWEEVGKNNKGMER